MVNERVKSPLRCMKLHAPSCQYKTLIFRVLDEMHLVFVYALR